MKIIPFIIYASLLVLGLAAGGGAQGQDSPAGPYGTEDESGDTLFTAEELDDLIAPIALYPDPLIAQILPAATFIDQIDAAARYVRQYGNGARIDDQPWDVSVKAVAHYPEILFMMDQKYDWTAALGQAFIDQQQDVMDAIQRLRAEAEAEGNLTSTPQQQVINEGDYISIVPAEPDMIFIPEYDPQVVYYERSPSFGFISFGIGLTIGAWLDRDCDWHGRRVFYHGWRGGGWISRARPHIHDRRNIYINNNNTVISLNRRVIQHNTVNFREDLRRNARDQRMHLPPAKLQTRDHRPTFGSGTRSEPPRPVPTVSRPPQQPPERPDNRALYRGREVQGPQPAARTGYGGYGSGREAATYRERGQASRANMDQFNRQQPVPAQNLRHAPAQRPAVISGPLPLARPPVAHSAPRQQPPASHRGEEDRKHR